MKRFLTLSMLTLIAAIALMTVNNAPRIAEARAHEAAAQAMKAQVTVTGMAVGGLLFLAVLLAIVLLAIIGLLIWLLRQQRPPYPTGRFFASSHPNPYVAIRSSADHEYEGANRRMKRRQRLTGKPTRQQMDDAVHGLYGGHGHEGYRDLTEHKGQEPAGSWPQPGAPITERLDWRQWEESPWDA